MKILLSLFVILMLPGVALASNVTCSATMGNCEVHPTGFSCECADGSGSAGESSAAADGDSLDTDGDAGATTLTEADCLSTLAQECGTEDCMTAKGRCVLYEGRDPECRCADGIFGETDGDNSEDSDPPQAKKVPLKAAASCSDTLTAACPNDPPDPAASCSTAELTFCTDSKTFLASCGSKQIIWPYQMIRCCEQYRKDKETYDTLWACMSDKGCDKFTECFVWTEDGDYDDGSSNLFPAQPENEYVDGDKAADGDESVAPDGDAATDDSSKKEESKDDDGCAQTGLPGLFLLLLFALPARRLMVSKQR